MSVQPLVDLRPFFAAELRELADRIERNEVQPVAIECQIYWRNSSVTRINRASEGFNFYAAAGIHLKIANELTSLTKEVPFP